ncbi:MAG: MerR family transcriptional regulator [Desulfobacterales bacterium]|jgi:DNA-binding transcriptional MerR regulator
MTMQEITQLPDKLYFKIGEVSKIAQLPTYVLRFWESEFSCIRPKRTSTGQRLYRRTDVETVLKIRHLLHERKFTIEGARQFLSTQKNDKPVAAAPLSTKELKDELESIRKLLEDR